ncbi:MAG TPA: DinB family protein [Vicinamibacterales bacterium]|nr:DinB family protein [Vicinamibacterales bacterium]
MQPDERQQLIAQYKDGYRVVAEALVKATPEQLDAAPGPGKWTARQIVHHLADSEMTAAVRFRLLVAEDRPSIKGYDQDRFADRLHYERPHEASLELFRAARASTAELMGCLTESDWLREGTHSEVGRFGLDTWLRIYGPHAHKHAEQIRVALRAAKQTR